MITTIPVQERTRELLRRIAGKSQSYDELIRQLIEIREAFIDHLYTVLEKEKFTSLEKVARELGLKI
jgi:mevalonate kinase